MPTERRCEKCGTVLAPFGTEALCPNCMLREAIGLEADLTAQLPAVGRATPTSAEALADSNSSIVNPKVRYFGDYELLEEIAHGGMGVVYKARQASLNRIVALKMILAGPYARREFIQRFRAEAEAAAKLQHPNIVAIHEVGEYEGHHYFSMDYVKGQNLADFVRDKPLTAHRAAALVKTVAEAIHYAHQQGILHRDLKPSNVLIDQFDQARVTDFGLAKQFVAQVSSPASPGGIPAAPKKSGQGRPEGSQAGTPALQNALDLTATGQVLGTPNYMPPEQACGKRGEIGPPSDLYSIGAILYFLLTARPPFFAETFEETIFQVLNAEVPSPRLLNASIPRDLETICLKCLEKEPRKRYSTAQELAGDLRRFLASEPINARPVRAVYRAWRWVKRKPTTAWLIAVSAAAILTVLVGVLYFNTQLTERLWQSLLSEARAQRAVQNRQRAIELITEAGRIKKTSDLRREAVQSIILPQLRLIWELPVRQCRLKQFSSDSSLLLAGEEVISLKSYRSGPASRRINYSGNVPSVPKVTAWDMATGQLVGETDWDVTGGAFAASPTDSLVAVPKSNSRVSLWEPRSGRDQAQFRARGTLVFNPNGTRLAVAEPNRVQVWNVRTQRLEAAREQVKLIAFSGNDWMLFRDTNNTIIRWNISTGEEIALVPNNAHAFSSTGEQIARVTNNANAFAVSADGSSVAMLERNSGDTHNRLWVHDLNRNRVTEFPEAVKRASVLLSPHGNALAVMEPPYMLFRIWSVSSQQPRYCATEEDLFSWLPSPDLSFESESGRVTVRQNLDDASPWFQAGVSQFSRDGSMFVSQMFYDGPNLDLWNVQTGSRVATVDGEAPAWSPDDAFLATSFRASPFIVGGYIESQTPRVKVWAVSQAVTLGKLDSGPVQWVAFSADGKQLAANRSLWHVRRSGDGVKLDSASFVQWYRILFGSAGQIFAVHDGQHAGTLWQLSPAPERKVADLGDGFFSSRTADWTISSDGKRLVLAAADSGLQGDYTDQHYEAWDLVKGEKLATWKPNNVRNSNSISGWIALQPDGRRFATSVFVSNGFDVWDVDTQALVRHCSYVGAEADIVLFASDWKFFAAVSGRRLTIREAELGRALATCDGHVANVRAIAFSSANRILASGGEDRTIRLWYVPSGRELACWDAHESTVRSLAFSPDGALLVSGSDLRIFKVWNLALIRRELAALKLDSDWPPFMVPGVNDVP